MQGSVQFMPNNRDLGMVMREVDENLAIFLGMRNGDKEKIDSHELDITKDAELKSDNLSKPKASKPDQNVADDIFLNLEIDKSGYDWLVTQCESTENQIEILNDEVDPPKSELTSNTKEYASMSKSSSSAAKTRPSLSEHRKPTKERQIKLKPSRASTPTPRSTLDPSRATSETASTFSKPMHARKRSSTPFKATNNISASSKSGSRSSTPTRNPANASKKSNVSGSDRSASSGRKTGLTMSKDPAPPSRGASQTVKSGRSKSSETITLSLDATQITKISLPKRPASRGRSSASATRDDVNPVLMGTKMVERVVNMRKLAPPKQDNYVFSLDNPKKSSLENSGFGRSLSKKSLDMAIRHMDIRRSICDDLQPIASGLSSYSARGVRYSASKNNLNGVLESPTTSSSNSSKSSNGVYSYSINGSQMDD